MSRVIQLISHNNHLLALTEDGEIFHSFSMCDPEWHRVQGPVVQQSPTPPRFSDLLEYDPPSPPLPPKPRRPTSIGPDGNYIQPLGD